MLETFYQTQLARWDVYGLVVAGLMCVMLLAENIAWGKRVRALPDARARRRLVAGMTVAPLTLIFLLIAGRIVRGESEPWVLPFVAGGLAIGLVLALGRAQIVEAVHKGWSEGARLRGEVGQPASSAATFVDLTIAFTILWSVGAALLYLLGAK